MRCLWNVVPVVDNIVVVAILQDAVMAGAMHRLVFIGLKDTPLINIRSHRANGACGILYAIGVVVARAGRVGKVVDAVLLEDKWRLEEVLNLGVKDQFLVGKRLHVGIETCHSAAETLVDAPCTEVDVDLAIVVLERLTVECDGVMHKAVFDKHGIGIAQHVLPRAQRGRSDALVEHTWLAIEVAIESVRRLHDVGSPHHLRRRPVHQVVGPVAKVLRSPHLGRSVAIAGAVGGGIYIIGIAKLTDGWVGKVARNDGVSSGWSVPLRGLKGRLPGGVRCLRSM